MKLKILKFLDIAIEYSVYGIIFFIPTSIAALNIFAGIAIALFLFKKTLSADFNSIKSNKILFFFLSLFFIFMALSLFNSGPFFTKSLNALLIKWGRGFLLLWIILDTFTDTRRITKALLFLLFSATLVGFSVFSQKFFGRELLRGRPLVGLSVTGPFENQNGLAAYLTSVIPIILSFVLWKRKQIAVQLLLVLVTIMLIASSLWTNCRGAWVGLISGLFFVILITTYHRVKKWSRIMFFSFFIFCIPLIAFALFFLHNRQDSNRFILTRGAWNMIKENPFLGKGVGTFMDYCNHYVNGFGVYYAHNCFLQIWAESGIFSLLSFILFTGYVIYKSIKVTLKIPSSLNFFLLTGLTAGLLGFLIHSFFDVHLYSLQLSFLFWVVLGLTAASSRSTV